MHLMVAMYPAGTVIPTMRLGHGADIGRRRSIERIREEAQFVLNAHAGFPMTSEDGFVVLNNYRRLFLHLVPAWKRRGFCGACQLWKAPTLALLS